MPTVPSPTKTYHKRAYPSIGPTRPELSAAGKTVLITGGGTGIGAEVAKGFAKAGASRIALLGRREQVLLDTKAEIEANYSSTEVFAIATDMTEKSEVDNAFARIAGDGKIDVLISNAAMIGAQAAIADLSAEEFLAGVIPNLQGNFNLTKAFLRHAAANAVLIESNSLAAHLNWTNGFACYKTSKAATARFYSALAYDYPELSVFCVQPGAVLTDMLIEAGYEKDKWKGEGNGAADELDDASLSAGFMVWLASPEARFLNGKYLWVNWDVDELKARAKEIEGSSLLNLGLIGWPFGSAGLM
jgi:NAD(P)-dependent dehydrogenase (short-subunit alcohol dehydrogenase family)